MHIVSENGEVDSFDKFTIPVLIPDYVREER